MDLPGAWNPASLVEEFGPELDALVELVLPAADFRPAALSLEDDCLRAECARLAARIVLAEELGDSCRAVLVLDALAVESAARQRAVLLAARRGACCCCPSGGSRRCPPALPEGLAERVRWAALELALARWLPAEQPVPASVSHCRLVAAAAPGDCRNYFSAEDCRLAPAVRFSLPEVQQLRRLLPEPSCESCLLERR